MIHNILHRIVLSVVLPVMLLFTGIQLSAETASYTVGPSRLPLWKEKDINGAVVVYAAHGATVKVEEEELSGWMYVVDTKTGKKGWTLKFGLVTPETPAMTTRQHDSLMVAAFSLMNVDKSVVSYYEEKSGYYMDDDDDMGCGEVAVKAEKSSAPRQHKKKSKDGTFWSTLLAFLPALLPAGGLYFLSEFYSAEEEKKKAVKSKKLPIWGIVLLVIQGAVFVVYMSIFPKVNLPLDKGWGWAWATLLAVIIFLIFFCNGVLRFHMEMYKVYDLKTTPVILKGALSFFILGPFAAFAAGGVVYFLLHILGINEDFCTGTGVVLGALVMVAMPVLSMRKAILKQNPEAEPMVGLLILFDILALIEGIVVAIIAFTYFVVKNFSKLAIFGANGTKGLGHEDLLGAAHHCGSCKYYHNDCPYNASDGDQEACSNFRI